MLINPEDKCELSKTIDNNDPFLKITFWYYLWGETISELRIMKDNSVLWSSKKQQQLWAYGQANLPIGKYDVRI